jgi:hypothetical protein
MTTSDGLVLDGVRFPVERATFSSNGKEWILSVDCGESPELAAGEHCWKYMTPRLYADGAPIRVDADAPVVEIATDSGWLGDEPLLSLYVHEHEAVTRSRGRLRRDGAAYRLELEGEAEVMGVAYPFTVTTALLREPWPSQCPDPMGEPRFLK